MTPIRPGIRRLFRLDTWRRVDATRDVNEEMRLHIALRAEQLMRGGMSAEDAERQASRLFASSESTIQQLHDVAIERNRHMRFREQLEALMQDTRYAARRLAHEPAITAFIVCTLALGIGMNVAAFTVVDRLLLRGPQQVKDADRLIRIYNTTVAKPLGLQTSPWLPHSAFTVLRDGLQSVDGVGAYRVGEAMVGTGAYSETRPVSMMSSEMFGVLGVQPVKGRFFGASEDADNLAVISATYWKSALGADPEIIGKSVSIDDVPHTIVGVAPSGFTGAELGRVDIWTPIKVSARNSMNMQVVARVRQGLSKELVQSEIRRFGNQIDETLPKWASWLRGAAFVVAPIAYDEHARESLESVMARWLAAISASILLITCANVANLLLARLARRRRELAVRIALGSGRSRIVRLFAIEGILLATGAALLAFVVVSVIEPLVQRALFPNGSWTFSIVDGRTLAAVMVLTLATGLLVAVAPAVQAGRRQLVDALRGGAGVGEGRSRTRAMLTIVQAMLSVVLLVGAGLFVRSLQRVSDVNLGMDADKIVTVELRYPRVARNPGESFNDWLARGAVVERERHRRLVEVARKVPGVEHAAVTVSVPFNGSVSVGIWVPGRDSIPVLPGGGPYVTAVGADYFATMGTPIHRGRAFTEQDREGSEPVVVISETMAHSLWPNENALDKCIIIHNRQAPCARVVGIASDLHRSGLKEDPSMQYYVPVGQERGFSGSWLLIRPRGKPSTTWPALREALQQADAGIRSIDVRLLSQGLDGEMRPFRLGIMSFGLSAVLALIVAGLGLYSVMAHAVAWRRHEIGVRLALGAQTSMIVRMVVGRGVALAAVGVATGLFVALAARHWVEPFLFETSAKDPLVIGAVVATVLFVSLLAGWVPARQAVGVSPTEALRAE